jgi:CitMHS family citrate-Mg2+:H+ or citrate-Ca2+:H+ symporter
MVAVFMTSIMTRALSALIALILVPTVFAAAAGFMPALPDMMIDGITSIAPTGVLLLFAILYFGLMIDLGLFDPIVRVIVRVCQGDPLRVIVGSTLLTAVISLDGDGSTTYLLHCHAAAAPQARDQSVDPSRRYCAAQQRYQHRPVGRAYGPRDGLSASRLKPGFHPAASFGTTLGRG